MGEAPSIINEKNPQFPSPPSYGPKETNSTMKNEEINSKEKLQEYGSGGYGRK